MRIPASRRRRLVLVAVGAAVAVLVSACGGGSSDRSAAPEVEPDGRASAFPVTIAQPMGAVTIAAEPKGVVALDYNSADNAYRPRRDPVGIAEVPYVEGGLMDWTRAALGDHEPVIFNVDDGLPFETIARLDPDVILATNTYPYIADHWNELNAIAPVVGHVVEPFKDTWEQGVTQVGTALGRSAEARQLISDVESQIARARTAHPEFAGRTVSFFNYMGIDGLWVISSPEDFAIKFLTQLGFKGVTDTVARMAAGGRRVQISPERHADLEADLVMGTSSKGPEMLDELARHPTFSKVPALERGAFVPFWVGHSTAMVQLSALSVPFAIDELVPQMAEAIDHPARR